MMSRTRIAAAVVIVVGVVGAADALAAGRRAPRKTRHKTEGGAWVVTKIATLSPFGKSVDWSARRDEILSARRGWDTYYDVYRTKPDGTGFEFLTHDKPGCPQMQNGNPAWHPGGRYIVFTGQNPDMQLPADLGWAAIPGSGIGHDLWLMDTETAAFHRLTEYALQAPYRAVIHPQFSNAGDKIAWAERIERGDSLGGGWVMKLADFPENTAKGAAPELANVRTLAPANRSCFYETHDFSPDDSRLLFSGNLQPGQSHVGLDIYALNLKTQQLERLTHTDDDWDEHAHYSPDGRHIAWMSSEGLDVVYGSTQGKEWANYLKTELWIMEAGGANKQQLTHFNTPGHPEYMDGARCVVSDSAWSPDGRRIVMCVAWCDNGRWGVKLAMLELEGAANVRTQTSNQQGIPCFMPALVVGLGALALQRTGR